MSDFLKLVDAQVSAEDWQLMAKHAGMPADELRTKILGGLSQNQNEARQSQNISALQEMSLSDVETDADGCQTVKVDIPLPVPGLSTKVTATFCFKSATDWSARIEICLVVFGQTVRCQSFTLDPHHTEVCLKFDVFLASLKVCLSLVFRPGRICLNISGEACLVGAGCEKFDETIFCIPIP